MSTKQKLCMISKKLSMITGHEIFILKKEEENGKTRDKKYDTNNNYFYDVNINGQSYVLSIKGENSR